MTSLIDLALFGERFEEQLKALSAIHYHHNTTDHTTTVGNFSNVEREEKDLARSIKEAIFIKLNQPSPNRNIGKYHLHTYWMTLWSTHHK